MKTVRLVMIATFVSLVMVSLANLNIPDPQPDNKLISMHFEQAIRNPRVVMAMYQQLDNGLLNAKEHTYSVNVLIRNYTVNITGTRSQWVWFFSCTT